MSYDLSQNLLIIGAGAHVPYSMPTGKAIRQDLVNVSQSLDLMGSKTYIKNPEALPLFNEICDLVQDLPAIQELSFPVNPDVQRREFVVEASRVFFDQFSGSMALSIDSYLTQIAKHDKHKHKLTHSDRDIQLEIGLLTLVRLIHRYEQSTRIGTHTADWIHDLIDNYIQNDLDAFFRKPPSIITFNYDRILENHLLSHLVARFPPPFVKVAN